MSVFASQPGEKGYCEIKTEGVGFEQKHRTLLANLNKET